MQYGEIVVKWKRNPMITPGTILMPKDTPRPPCFHLEGAPYSNDWISVKHNLGANELDAKLFEAGWTFFYMAGGIRATAFGFDQEGTINAALKRLIAAVKLQKCNCLEIEDVKTRSFLGIPQVSVSARPRHIQRGSVFSGQ